MKIYIAIFLFGLITLRSQTYLNIDVNSGSDQFAQIANIASITFNSQGTQMTVTYNGSETYLFNISDIVDLTYSDSPVGSVLPVELVNFSAKLNGDKVNLTWSTASEIDNYGFEIQRANVGTSRDLSLKWETIGFVEGTGYSSSPKNYSFVDTPDINTSKKIEYRLKQIDFDGAYEYSNSVAVQLGIPDEYVIMQNYPNPFNPKTIIEYSLPEPAYVKIQVFNTIGEEVALLANQKAEAGKYSVHFDGSNLNSGVYLCRLELNGKGSTIKMMLIK